MNMSLAIPEADLFTCTSKTSGILPLTLFIFSSSCRKAYFKSTSCEKEIVTFAPRGVIRVSISSTPANELAAPSTGMAA